jgi:hypothetical protein
MGKENNIVHQYFKKEIDGSKILVKVNSIHWKGTEVTIFPGGHLESRDLDFDPEIFEDLKEDGFDLASPLEFNLYVSGLVK